MVSFETLSEIAVILGLISIAWAGAVCALALLAQHRWSAESWPAYWLGALLAVLLPAGTGVLSPMLPDFDRLFIPPPAPAAPAPAAAPTFEPFTVVTAPAAEVSEPVFPLIAIILALIYAAGLTVFAARAAWRGWQFHRIAASATPCRADALGLHTLHLDSLDPDRSAIRLRITQCDISPFAARLAGRPVIVLPQHLIGTLTPGALELIVRHETAHLRRGDLGLLRLLTGVDVIFWFNPFVRLLTARTRTAVEIACDAEALSAAPHMRKAYAQSLIGALRMSAEGALPRPSAGFSPQNLRSHKMRIHAIMKGAGRAGKSPRHAVAVVALSALLALPGAGLSVALAQPAADFDGNFSNPLPDGRLTAGYNSHDAIRSIVLANGRKVSEDVRAAMEESGERVKIILNEMKDGETIRIEAGEIEKHLKESLEEMEEQRKVMAKKVGKIVIRDEDGTIRLHLDGDTIDLKEAEIVESLEDLNIDINIDVEEIQKGLSEGLAEAERIRGKFIVNSESIRRHTGIDLAAPAGTAIRAPAAGRVIRATDRYQGGEDWGKVVVIDHGNGWETIYAHLQDYNVQEGDTLRRGERFARVGATGAADKPHLHVEVKRDGKGQDPAKLFGIAPHEDREEAK